MNAEKIDFIATFIKGENLNRNRHIWLIGHCLAIPPKELLKLKKTDILTTDNTIKEYLPIKNIYNQLPQLTHPTIIKFIKSWLSNPEYNKESPYLFADKNGLLPVIDQINQAIKEVKKEVKLNNYLNTNPVVFMNDYQQVKQCEQNTLDFITSFTNKIKP